MRIISRAEWGAKRTPRAPRPIQRVTGFYVHYHGGPPPTGVGVRVPRNIEAIHLANGWNNGVGYHFMVDQVGTIYEGRGWNNIGAHSPPHNTDGLGVYVAIGGDQKPTDAALASVRALYDEACKKTGRTLYKRWHGYDYPTACPGPRLIAWVKAGMPVSGKSLPPLEEQEWTPTGTWSTKDIQALVGVTADGVYGPGTTRAVAALQESLDLTADGLWGRTTEGAVMTILTDIQADLKAVKTTQNEHTAAIAEVERWTRQGVNNSLWAGPSRTIAALSAVLADTQGVDVDKLAAAIAEQIRDDVAKAGSGATAEQIADVLAKRLAS